jgi:hypothetical protein
MPRNYLEDYYANELSRRRQRTAPGKYYLKIVNDIMNKKIAENKLAFKEKLKER